MMKIYRWVELGKLIMKIYSDFCRNDFFRDYIPFFSKIKVIDIYNNLQIRPTQDLRNLGLNLNFLSHECLKRDVASNIGPRRKYNAIPKKFEINCPGAVPFHLVGSIPEYFRKVKQGSNKFREIIKRRHPTRDITNLPRFCTKLGAEPNKSQIILAIKNCHSKIIPN